MKKLFQTNNYHRILVFSLHAALSRTNGSYHLLTLAINWTLEWQFNCSVENIKFLNIISEENISEIARHYVGDVPQKSIVPSIQNRTARPAKRRLKQVSEQKISEDPKVNIAINPDGIEISPLQGMYVTFIIYYVDKWLKHQ